MYTGRLLYLNTSWVTPFLTLPQTSTPTLPARLLRQLPEFSAMSSDLRHGSPYREQEGPCQDVFGEWLSLTYSLHTLLLLLLLLFSRTPRQMGQGASRLAHLQQALKLVQSFQRRTKGQLRG